MNWLTKRVMYYDFPLHVRRPDYQDIWNYKSQFNKLLNISHFLDKVTQKGLPESNYNSSLSDLDENLCNMFADIFDGFIFLIETYGGERNYWYYISSSNNYLNKIEEIKVKFPAHNIVVDLSDDADWDFINSYPFELYKK